MVWSGPRRFVPWGEAANWRRDIFGMAEQQLSNACIEAVEKIEPASAQCHGMGEQEAKGINWSQKDCKPSKASSIGVSCPSCYGLHPWRFSRLVNLWAIWSEFGVYHAFSRRLACTAPEVPSVGCPVVRSLRYHGVQRWMRRRKSCSEITSELKQLLHCKRVLVLSKRGRAASQHVAHVRWARSHTCCD